MRRRRWPRLLKGNTIMQKPQNLNQALAALDRIGFTEARLWIESQIVIADVARGGDLAQLAEALDIDASPGVRLNHGAGYETTG
jgi:hypothetical protein